MQAKRKWNEIFKVLKVKNKQTNKKPPLTWNGGFDKVILQKVKVLVAQSYPTLETPWTVAHQAPLFMEFSRQEYWSGLPFPSPRDLPNPGMEPGSPALQADSLPTEPSGKLSILQK